MHPCELLTLRELARRLQLSQSWLHEEADRGRIPFLQAGRRRLYNLQAVEQALLDRASAHEPGEENHE